MAYWQLHQRLLQNSREFILNYIDLFVDSPILKDIKYIKDVTEPLSKRHCLPQKKVFEIIGKGLLGMVN